MKERILFIIHGNVDFGYFVVSVDPYATFTYDIQVFASEENFMLPSLEKWWYTSAIP